MIPLSTDEQIEKLNQATRLAEDAAASPEVASRLGALVLYAGLVDFAVIQAARLVEQIVLKGQLAEGNQPSFQPKEDSFFYSRKVSTARILRGIRKLLLFKAGDASNGDDAARITKLAQAMVAAAFTFLDYRDPLLHQIGNPERTFQEVLAMADQAILAYQAFRESHKQLFEAASPYRFGPAELAHFYGQK